MDLNGQIKSLEYQMNSCKKKALIISDKITELLKSPSNIKKSDIELYQQNYSKISENLKQLQSKLTKIYEKKYQKIQSKTDELNLYKNFNKECQKNPNQLKLAMSKIAF